MIGIIMNVWIVIAAYNEEKVIRSVIESVVEAYPDFSVVVVDDHSKDRTSEEALRAGRQCLHCVNQGQGAALQTGTTFALRNGADAIIHFDADGQHQASDIPKFLAALESGCDVALGSRFLGSAVNIPLLKRCILKIGTLFTWMFSGIKLTDTHNGFRALTRAAAHRITIQENRSAHASEILHDIRQYGLRVTEIPVTILYTDYSLSRGQSSWNALSVVGRIVWRKLFLE